MKVGMLKAVALAVGLAGATTALADSYLIKDVRVFDGKKVHARRSVLLDGGKIASADFKGKAPEGAKVVEGAGRTLMPGLIDSHVHAYRYLDLPLLFGVTTQVDMFTSVPTMQDMSGRMQRGQNKDRADLFSAGHLATVPGGHGTEYGIAVPTLTRPEEAQAWVDERIAEGSHFIKIVLEKGFPGHPMNSLDVPTVKALVDASHKRGKLAVVHISRLEDARAALETGADGLVHLFTGEAIAPADLKAFVKLARERKAFIIPTFSVMESIAGLREKDIIDDKGMAALLDKEQMQVLHASHGRAQKPHIMTAPNAVVAALSKAGVPLLAGTDAGNPGTIYGASMHHELLSMTKAGMSPRAALASATSVPAKAFRLGQRGQIANGYKADVVLVEGDPTTDIGATRRIVEVWKDGEVVSPARSKQQQLVAQELNAPKSTPLALPADGRISLFSKDKLASPFGSGWMPSNDAFLGGKSTVKVEYADEAAVSVQASVQPGFAFPWAGLAFMPGKAPMAAADLSEAKVLRFRVRGDGQRYAVSIMSKAASIPVNLPFETAADWQEVSLPLASFKGVDASMITMIAFNAGPKPGDYQFQISDVRLMAQ